MKVEQLTITSISDVQSGTSKAGKEWQKLTFVGNTSEEYNNLYAFELFGAEKVENFNKYNKVGSLVDVDFNVSTREWEGKYYTSLSAWKIFKAETAQVSKEATPVPEFEGTQDDLPF